MYLKAVFYQAEFSARSRISLCPVISRNGRAKGGGRGETAPTISKNL